MATTVARVPTFTMFFKKVHYVHIFPFNENRFFFLIQYIPIAHHLWTSDTCSAAAVFHLIELLAVGVTWKPPNN